MQSLIILYRSRCARCPRSACRPACFFSAESTSLPSAQPSQTTDKPRKGARAAKGKEHHLLRREYCDNGTASIVFSVSSSPQKRGRRRRARPARKQEKWREAARKRWSHSGSSPPSSTTCQTTLFFKSQATSSLRGCPGRHFPRSTLSSVSSARGSDGP